MGITKCVISYSLRRLRKAVLTVNTVAKGVILYVLYITNKTERFSFRSTGGEMFKRRLVHSAAVAIST